MTDLTHYLATQMSEWGTRAVTDTWLSFPYSCPVVVATGLLPQKPKAPSNPGSFREASGRANSNKTTIMIEQSAAIML